MRFIHATTIHVYESGKPNVSFSTIDSVISGSKLHVRLFGDSVDMETELGYDEIVAMVRAAIEKKGREAADA